MARNQTTGIKVSLTTSISFALRSYFSVNHISSAALFAREAYRLERDHGNLGTNVPEEIRLGHVAFVNGSILFAAFFLEAYINEIFSDISDAFLSLEQNRKNIPSHKLISISNLPPMIGGEITEEVVRRVGGMWPTIEKLPTLQKYQTALVLNDKQRLVEGAGTYQDADLLVKLRNYLAHFYPEALKTPGSDDFTEEDIHKLGKRFQSKNLTFNPFTSPGNPFFPDQCLGHGCAEWAVNASVKFVNEFSSNTVWKPLRFESTKGRLQTK
ncbi:MAG: hypothetical protein M1303_00570 [Bacteroidetes bacterium]|nr:hypothetical protein [Bacteroidota bacterium]